MISKCKICRTPFEKKSIGHKVCSAGCALLFNQQEKDRKAKKEYRMAKDRLKSRRDWLKDAQTAFNAYIRERDAHLPCISCGRHHEGQYHAGHYLSVGAHPELRFHEDNNHKQCSPCNNHLSGNIVRYRENLLLKIGKESLERLEGANDPQKYTIPELQEIRRVYVEKRKQLIVNTKIF